MSIPNGNLGRKTLSWKIKIVNIIYATMGVLLLSCDKPTTNLWPSVAYDAGIFFSDENGDIAHKFIIQNTTNRRVKFSGARKSCNCTDFSLAQESLEISEKTILKMSVKNLMRTKGSYSVTVHLDTDQPDYPGITYSLNYRVHNRIEFNSTSVYLGKFSHEKEVEDDNTATININILSKLGSFDDIIEKVTTTSPLRLISLGEPIYEILEGGTIRQARYNASITLSKPGLLGLSTGSHTGTVNVLTRSGNRSSVPIFWEVSSPIELSPSPFSFGFVRKSDFPYTKHVIMKSVSEVKFKIL
jgi:hypothetical protein